jgi:uncharacterized protein YutE (UPF0331/DUF86 family)
VTPRSLDEPVLQAKLGLIGQLVDDLDAVAVTPERLKDDRMVRYAVERILVQLVDLAVSINGHVAAVRIGRGPADYRESFALAARARAITADLAGQLSPSVGLRNVLTHEYVEVDPAVVVGSSDQASAGYREYVRQVAPYLAGRPT